MRVGTYKIPAPASINGTLRCTYSHGQKGASISFTDFADVARATAYTAALTPPGGPPLVTLIPAGVTSYVYISANGAPSNGNGGGTYTFTLTAKVGSWTGTPLTQTVIC